MAENISAELAYLHLFEDIKAIVFPLEEFGLLEEDIFVNCFLFRGGCTRRVMNLFMSSYIKVSLENEYC